MKTRNKFLTFMLTTAITFGTLWLTLGKENFNRWHRHHYEYWEHHHDHHNWSDHDEVKPEANE